MRIGRGARETVLRVDGGMVASDWTMQFLVGPVRAAPVDRPTVLETTALGAAYLAGMQAGLCAPLQVRRAGDALAPGTPFRATNESRRSG
jgi:glycerol kinase